MQAENKNFLLNSDRLLLLSMKSLILVVAFWRFIDEFLGGLFS